MPTLSFSSKPTSALVFFERAFVPTINNGPVEEDKEEQLAAVVIRHIHSGGSAYDSQPQTSTDAGGRGRHTLSMRYLRLGYAKREASKRCFPP